LLPEGDRGDRAGAVLAGALRQAGAAAGPGGAGPPLRHDFRPGTGGAERRDPPLGDGGLSAEGGVRVQAWACSARASALIRATIDRRPLERWRLRWVPRPRCWNTASASVASIPAGVLPEKSAITMAIRPRTMRASLSPTKWTVVSPSRSTRVHSQTWLAQPWT